MDENMDNQRCRQVGTMCYDVHNNNIHEYFEEGIKYGWRKKKERHVIQWNNILGGQECHAFRSSILPS